MSSLPGPEAPVGLEGRILDKVRRAKRQGIIARLALSLAACAAGLAYMVVQVQGILGAIRQSALYGMLRLVWSDPDIVFGNFQDAAFGLVENIPFGAIALVAGLVFSAICALEFGLAWRHLRRPPRATFPI